MSASLVRALVSGLADVADSDITTAWDIATTRVHPAEWGALYQQAVAYMTGHILLRAGQHESGQRQGAGGIASESAGGWSRSYGGNSSSANAEMATTQAGSDYLALRRRAIMGARVIG